MLNSKNSETPKH